MTHNANVTEQMLRPSAAVLVIIDGLSDVGALTPLQRAKTPTLDAAAARGRNGLIDPVEAGTSCGSDTAHLSILGYDPRQHYRGRGAFESLGAGIPMSAGHIAFKCNFAVMDNDGVVVRRCAGTGRAMHELAAELCEMLDGTVLREFPGVRVSVKHAVQHRCGVVIRGESLSDCVSNTDPLVDGRPLQTCVAVDGTDAAAVRTAAIVNRVTDTFRRAIAQHVRRLQGERGAAGVPGANVLLLRGASEHIEIEPFAQRHGLATFMIAPTKIIAGIGMTAGIDVIAVANATGDYNTNLSSKARACVKNLMREDACGYIYDLAIVHVKAVDEAGHEQDDNLKTIWLEKTDAMVYEILQLLSQHNRRDVVLIVTGDHTTPTVYGEHTCEPVPILFADVFDPSCSDTAAAAQYIGTDECTVFDETSAGMHGSLGRFSAIHLMWLVTSVLAK